MAVRPVPVENTLKFWEMLITDYYRIKIYSSVIQVSQKQKKYANSPIINKIWTTSPKKQKNTSKNTYKNFGVHSNCLISFQSQKKNLIWNSIESNPIQFCFIFKNRKWKAVKLIWNGVGHFSFYNFWCFFSFYI